MDPSSGYPSRFSASPPSETQKQPGNVATVSDYFTRYSRDPEARPAASEVAIGAAWKILLPVDAHSLSRRLAEDLADFLGRRMDLKLPREQRPRGDLEAGPPMAISLIDRGGGDGKTAGSFTLTVKTDRVIIAGRDPEGLRDGVVKLVDLIGFRQAPFLADGTRTFKPRLATRLGAAPWLGSYREAVFLGYNAVFVGGGSLHGLSASDAIPELAARRNPASRAALTQTTRAAAEYGLKTYALLDTRQRFPKDNPVFAKHPDLRGALTWQANGDYVLCTEHPLVKRYLAESVADVFKAAPGLDGVVIIIGGEGFYHCFMHPFGAEKGHTNCVRCEGLGAETVVANLCNTLAEATRAVEPAAEVIAWPYSGYVWSADSDQAGFISKLKPGVAILTEVEKDETLKKPDGVSKLLWDYSIDMIGPGPRARGQLAACKAAGIPLYFKSEPELSFEAARLPYIPCPDRWLGRAEAIAGSGADGSFVFSGTGRSLYASTTAEVYKYANFDPVADHEEVLRQLATRVAGAGAGPHLRKAWKLVSEAVSFDPLLAPYYVGPYYLGPAHPMCADPAAPLPDVFSGYMLYMVEISEAEGMKRRPTYLTKVDGDVGAYLKAYRRMDEKLAEAAAEIQAAAPLVPRRCRLMFDSESSVIRWYAHTVRTVANFHESCQLRARFDAYMTRPHVKDSEQARRCYERWLGVLKDERANTAAALAVAGVDMRLDCYYGGDHSYSHIADMIRAKLPILDQEANVYLPSLWKKYEAATVLRP